MTTPSKPTRAEIYSAALDEARRTIYPCHTCAATGTERTQTADGWADHPCDDCDGTGTSLWNLRVKAAD